jgi:opacity protein-like surface antigen
MRRRFSTLLCAMALTVFGVSSQAAADWDDDNDRYDDTRIYGGLWLGFGGDIEFEGIDVGDLGKTIGGQAGVDVVVARYFSLGGEVRVGGFDVDGFDTRNRLIDLDFKPRLRLPLRGPLELYATVPVGLTIPRLADIEGRGGLDENLGWNLGVGAGLNWFLTDNFGLNVEPIWLMHNFGFEGPLGDGDVKMKQFAVMLNAVLAL